MKSVRSVFLIAAFLCPGIMAAQEKSVELIQDAKQKLAKRGEVVIRFKKPADPEFVKITGFLSIDQLRNDTVTAYANEKTFMQFVAENIPYEIIQAPSLHLNLKSASESVNWRFQYPSYPKYVALMDSFAAQYPDICRLVEFGQSVNGHKLLAVKISDNVLVQEMEPVVLLSSTMHGDEPLGYVLMLRTIDELLTRYPSEESIKRLVDSVQIWIHPLANPDGTYFISDSSVEGSTRFNANQVDLNRNFPDPTDGDHPDSYAWQSETIAMMNFMDENPPVLAANFHGGTELVNYPWDAMPQYHPDDTWYQHISNAYASTARTKAPDGYMTAQANGITNGYGWYVVHGGRQDYVNYFLHGREVTIELSYDKIPAESSLDNYWNYNRQSILQYIGQVFTGFTGIITDSISGLPVRAKITIPYHDKDHSEVYSYPSDGVFYRLTRPGGYTFEISAPGYTTKSIRVFNRSGRLSQRNIELSPETSGILYPNPFADVIYTNIFEPGETLLFEMTDLTGRKVRQITQNVTFSGRQELRVNGLFPGVYVASITYRQKTTKQIVVRK